MANSSQKPTFDPTRFITSAATLTETDIDSCKRTDVPLQVPQRRLLSRSLSLDSFQDLLNRRLAAEQEDKLFDQQLLLQDQLPSITSDIARLSLLSHVENSPLDDMSGLMIPREKGLPAACIFVAHLEKSVDDRFLHQALFITMAKFGTILDLQVHRDPRYFRPYAFVQFKNVADAERAAKTLTGQLLFDRPLRVEKARVNRTLFISKMERDLIEQQVHDLISQYGPLEEIKMLRDKNSGAFKGCVFAKFVYRQDCINAILPLESYDYKVELVPNLNPKIANTTSDCIGSSAFGAVAEEDSAEASTIDTSKGQCLYLSKLPLSVNESDLVEKFSGYGKITALNLLRKKDPSTTDFYNSGSNYAYLTYATADAAAQAIRYEHNKLWLDKFISVEYVKQVAGKMAYGNKNSLRVTDPVGSAASLSFPRSLPQKRGHPFPFETKPPCEQ